MPKEIIESLYYGREVTDADTGKVMPVEATHLHVGWAKHQQHVEVAVINRAVESSFPGDTAPGWFMQLDRAGCNRAIRVLRKARDDAFERDE